MNAKEKQKEFIKSYLKPTLKSWGYQTNVQTWWKNKDDFFIVINIQNFSWNSKNKVDFCFNIGVALTAILKDPDKRKANYFDILTNVRENAYLPDNRWNHKFKNNNGYNLNDETDLIEFINELKFDFEKEILPCLNKLETLNDCLDFYSNIPFWYDYLKRVIKENNLKTKLDA